MSNKNKNDAFIYDDGSTTLVNTNEASLVGLDTTYTDCASKVYVDSVSASINFISEETVQEIVTTTVSKAWEEFFDDYFVVKNETTGDQVVGKISIVLPIQMKWKKAGNKYSINKIDKETAKLLYEKER